MWKRVTCPECQREIHPHSLSRHLSDVHKYQSSLKPSVLIYQIFEKLPSGKEARCKICKIVMYLPTAGVTQNLRQHAMRKHSQVWNEILAKESERISRENNKCDPLALTEKELIAKMFKKQAENSDNNNLQCKVCRTVFHDPVSNAAMRRHAENFHGKEWTEILGKIDFVFGLKMSNNGKIV